MMTEKQYNSYAEKLAKSSVTFWDSTKDQKLFYWTIPADYPPEQCADEGWYQWTERGLIYLGKEIEDIDDLRAQLKARERDLIALPQILSDLAKALERVKELELQVFLLTPTIQDVRITGSDHTTYNGEDVG